jgi:hypothetical protein
MMATIPTCPFCIGQRVTVLPENPDYDEWPGEFVVTAIRWEYQRDDSRIVIAIASDDEIRRGHGSSDGFEPSELLAVEPPRPTVEELDAILNDPTERKVVVLPDGSVTAVE